MKLIYTGNEFVEDIKEPKREDYIRNGLLMEGAFYDAKQAYQNRRRIPASPECSKVWKVNDVVEEGHLEYGVTCPECGGDGKETCNNPDHGFINGIGGELGRLGCPVCGHEPDHKVNGGRNICPVCNGSGHVSENKFDEYGDTNGSKRIIAYPKASKIENVAHAGAGLPSYSEVESILHKEEKDLLPNLAASTANLSQIKDKDKWLDEVRGREQPGKDAVHTTAGEAIELLRKISYLKQHKDDENQPKVWAEIFDYLSQHPQPAQPAGQETVVDEEEATFVQKHLVRFKEKFEENRAYLAAQSLEEAANKWVYDEQKKEIERLRNENKQLLKHVDTWTNNCNLMNDDYRKLQSQLTALREEVGGLKLKLRKYEK